MSITSLKHISFILAAAAALFAAGCGPVTVTVPDTPPVTPAVPTVSTLSGQADAAWRAGDMAKAEKLYAALRRDPALPAGQYDTVFSRLSEAALANGHPEAALDALQGWGTLKPEIKNEAGWVHSWGKTLMKLPQARALTLAEGAVGSALSSNILRAEAMGVMLARGNASNRLSLTDNMKALYLTSEQNQRAIMERGLLALAGEFTPDGLIDTLKYTVPETDRSFPWSVLLLEKARREARTMSSSGQETPPTLERINGQGVFADPKLVEDALAQAKPQETFMAIPSRVPLYPGCTAMALPLSGAYAAVGKSIAAGAEAAREELLRTGIERQVILVDTNKPDWLERLVALPAQCVTVGGPLLKKDYTRLKTGRMPAERAFFAFMSSLDSGDEGRVAWRFFGSPRDQINALLRYASQAGVRTFATLYPDEPYGRLMAGLFMEAAPGGRSAAVSSGTAYPPEDIAQWNNIVSNFVDSRMIGKIPASNAQFQAVFMPDSWSKSSLLIPYLFFYGEDRLLILGSNLWEQGVRKEKNLDPSNVRLAVFPAAWNSANLPPAARNLSALLADGREPDFWSGLGYDFVRFSAALRLSPSWSSSDVNMALQTASRINWSMAPLTWSPQGLVAQHFFILNPDQDGGKEIAPEDMAVRIEQIRARYDRRMGLARKKYKTAQAKKKAPAQGKAAGNE